LGEYLNAITSKLDIISFPTCEVYAPVDSTLYKFISIIQSTTRIKKLCNEDKIVIWLKHLDSQIEEEIKEETYCQEFVHPFLCMETHAITTLYANIVAQYSPQDDLYTHLGFNYYELVRTIKQVYVRHISNDEKLFTEGIQTTVEDKKFLSKVLGDRVFIFFNSGTYLGKGTYGVVYKVYEIASKQFYALKKATPRGCKALNWEIDNLNTLHRRAKELNLNVDGLQEAPVLTFNIHNEKCDLDAFISVQYGINLEDWGCGQHENAKRIHMGKSIIHAFKQKTQLGYWHGDLKLNNIVTHADGCKIIDWAGSTTFDEGSKSIKHPKTVSTLYMNYEDEIWMKEVVTLMKLEQTEVESLSIQYIEIAKAKELFAISIALFKTLCSCNPFESFQSSSGKIWPYTYEGIHKKAMAKLKEMNYSQEVVETITKMLAHDFKERYETQEAIGIWEKIE
jgi:hypothetical protein